MKTFTIILCLVSTGLLHAQSREEVELMRGAFKELPHKTPYLSARGNHNELQYLFSGMFLFYKTFISSQDGQSCSFTPSCSEYGMQAVKKYGSLLGIMITFDRLARCNGFSPEKYGADPSTGLLIDPLE